MKIAVAMSGGVDSSVAALMLKNAGHEVFGLTMRIWSCGDDEPVDPRVCCGPAAIEDAARVAGEIGIHHYVLGMQSVFEEKVIEHFISEYAAGRTPNPCVRCNRLVKFEPLLDKAVALGASRLATGHHAIVGRANGGFALRRARDSSKDQTYFLYGMTQAQLARVLMPVGELTKDEVRELARRDGLSVAERPESQDLCFVPGGDIAAFMARRLPAATEAGPIEDLSGRVLGEHRGIALYTIGQRSGLGLSLPRPAYVVRLDPDRNAVVVGDETDLLSTCLTSADVHWIAGEAPARKFRAEAKIRYAAPPAAATITLSGNHAHVTFDQPQRAVAPGQSVVFYEGDTVLGGGTIAARASSGE